MRTRQLALVATVALIIVGGSVTMAQTAYDPLASGSVTIQIVDHALVAPGVMRPDETRSTYHETDRQTAMTWVSSDPRLSGEGLSAGNRDINRDGSFIEHETYAIANDGGGWVGPGVGLGVAPPMPNLLVSNGPLPASPDHQDLVVLRGEGAYEGLSALVRIDWTSEPPAGSGTIVRGDLSEAPDLAATG
jgi:hypothetical protein